MHLLVMDKNLGWQTLQDPDVFESLIRGEPMVWVPAKAFLNEISEVRIFVADDQAEWLSERFS